MTHRNCILLVLLLSACTQKAAPPVFPPAVGSVWRLKKSQGFASGSAPDLIRKIGTRGGWSAEYDGPGSATLELYELTAPAGGLEMVQRWRPVADAVVWYTPRYFVVVKWYSTDRAAVRALIRAFEEQFREQG